MNEEVKQEQTSTIIDLQHVEDRQLPVGSEIDEENINGDSSDVTSAGDATKGFGKRVTSQVFEEGQMQVKKALNFYANVDILRPYFDVEPIQVRDRLIRSLVPINPSSMQQSVYSELYGPLMLVFTLVAVLLFGMKSSGTVIREGTVFGTAFGISFGYWFGASILYYAIAFLCNTNISFIQMLSLTGYALFGSCLCILSTTLYPPGSQSLFLLTWLILGGLSSIKMATVLLSRTWNRFRQGIIVAILVAAFHLFFLYYLRSSYVTMTLITSKLKHLEPTTDHQIA